MQRVDGFYLWTGSKNLMPLRNLKNDTKYSKAQITLYIAQGWLEPVVTGQSVFQLRTAWPKGRELLTAIQNAISAIEESLQASPPEDKELGWLVAYNITSALDSFETILAAEFAIADLFLVQKLPGFDVNDLIERGAVLFPADLATKVPETVGDANQAGRCLAFRLPTAAGFHLHRVNEAVLRRYYDAVTPGKPKPNNRTIGAYLKAFEKHKTGNAKVLAALDSLRELHRNPLMHPEESLENVDEALALYGAVHSVVVHMLKAIK
jgi:hypothetical protein